MKKHNNWKEVTHSMFSLVEHAASELDILGLTKDDSSLYEKNIADAVLELVEVFAEQNHSNSSAAYASFLFNKLAEHKPLTPLTGEKDEWVHVEGDLYQNKRYSAVFAVDSNGSSAFNVEAVVFVDSDGTCFVNSNHSKRSVVFPYTPRVEFIREGTEEAKPYAHLFAANEDKEDEI